MKMLVKIILTILTILIGDSNMNTSLTWIVFEVLKVDIRDVLMLHQVNSQCVLSTVDLVVGACKISNQFQFLTIMIFGYD